MELELLTRDELLHEVQNLKNENTLLKAEQEQVWDKVRFLIANLTHEFKTPLNSIIGFGELIQYKVKEEKILNYSEKILNCSRHMLSLVLNIIDITTSQYKPMELSYSIFNSREIIQEVIESFSDSDIEYTLADKDICADYTRFKQLVYNLISNGLKFKEDKHIKIITYLDNDFFCFEITDYGEGISEENYKKIFDFFTQVTTDTKKKQSGSGIGLPLCKIIVEAHGGSIRVSSEIGKGSTFIFRLPIDKVMT